MSRQLGIASYRYEIGDIHGAMRDLQSYLSEDPDSALAHAMLAGCLLHMRRIHAALNEARIALTLEPEQFLARLMHARVLMAHRKFDAAHDELDALIARHPEEAGLCRAMADLYMLRGEAGGAGRQKWLSRALQLEPSNSATLSDCAHYHLHRGELDLAEQMATQALQAAPESVSGAWIMGEIMLARGDLDAAREQAAFVLSRNAEHRGALTLLTHIKARRSPLLGLWWRFASWVSLGGEARAILILVGMFVAYRVSSVTLDLEGYDTAYMAVNIFWLAFVLYTFVAPVLLRRALQRELEEVRLDKNF